MAAPENKAYEVALSYYDQLLPVIPVYEVLVKLITKRIINLDDKQLIKAEKTSQQQAEYLLDNYILKRIQTGEDHILSMLLEAMRESGKCDSLVKKIYKDWGREPPVDTPDKVDKLSTGVHGMSVASAQNDNCTITTYLKAFKSCYRQMVQILPIDHFIIDLVEKNQLRHGLKSRIQARETREMRVQCLLDDIEGGIEAGCPERFIQLLVAIKEYATRQNNLELKKLSKDTLKHLPGAIVETRDKSVQCDILPLPTQPSYSVMLIGVEGCGKSAVCNFFFQDEAFESKNHLNSPRTTVIANNLVTMIDTPGFFYLYHPNEVHHVTKEIIRGTQLPGEGVNAVALVINISNRIDSVYAEYIESLMQNSSLISSAFALFTRAARVACNDDEQRQWLKDHLQDLHCPNILKRFMKQVKQRFIMLESVEPMGTNYHNRKSLELIAMIKNIFDDNNHRTLTKDDL